MDNIYYVGRDRNHQTQARNNTLKMRINKRSAKSNDSQSNYSSRKTETKVNNSNKNYNYIRRHFQGISRQSASPIYRSYYLRSTNKEQGIPFSPLRLVRQNNYIRSPNQNQNHQTQRIRFNRVEQAVTSKTSKTQGSILKTSKMSSLKDKTVQKIQENPQKNENKTQFNYYQIKKLQNYPFLVKNAQLYQSKQQETNQNYKIQPYKKIFLCETCCQFISIKELNNHMQNCTKPSSYYQYQQKWLKISELLKQLAKLESNTDALKLGDLIEWYLTKDRPAVDTDMILYSDDLNRILNYREVINLRNINTIDLFYLIEIIGDRLQIYRQKKPSQPFWKICS